MLQSFVYSVLLGSRVLFSLTSLRSFCLRLPRAALPKTVNGLWSRNATRFLLAAYHSPQAVSGCAGSVGYEQREPDNRRSSRVPSNSFEWPRHQEEDEAKLFEIVSPEFGRCPFLQDFRLERQFALFCGSQNRRPCRPGASRHGGRPNLSLYRTKWGSGEACMAARKSFWFFLGKERTVASNINVLNNRVVNETKKVFVPGGEQAPFFDFESSETVILDRFTQISER